MIKFGTYYFISFEEGRDLEKSKEHISPMIQSSNYHAKISV